MKTCWEHREGFGSEHCERCAEAYDSEVSGCPRCGAMVSNGAYFKRTSPHFKGTCKAPVLWPMPASFVERKTMKPRSYDCLTGFMASSNDYIAYGPELHSIRVLHARPSPVVVTAEEENRFNRCIDSMQAITKEQQDKLRLARLLEEQNELYRQIARKAA
jgi:hypothetical protein